MQKQTRKVGENALGQLVRLITEINEELCDDKTFITVELGPNGRGELMFNTLNSEGPAEVLFMFANMEECIGYLAADQTTRLRLSARN